MNSHTLGTALKKEAKASGSFVQVDVANVYDTLAALSHFFYRKKHEWMAICFLDKGFSCRLIWFNKGPSHTMVPMGLSAEDIIAAARNIDARHVVVAHNHPISSYDMPDYGTRRMNIQASRARKRAILGFSDMDTSLDLVLEPSLREEGIGYAAAVFVAGEYKLHGDDCLLENYNANRPKACFIATSVFGEHRWETSVLRRFRDLFLVKSRCGTALCDFYYRLSPYVADVIGRSTILRLLARIILRPLIGLAKWLNSIAKP